MTQTYYPCYCRKCQHQWYITTPTTVACPKCKSDNVNMEDGMTDTAFLELLVKTATPVMEWMVADMISRQVNPGNYSDELKRAIGILEVMREV